MQVTTRKAKFGKQICRDCGGEMFLRQQKNIILPNTTRNSLDNVHYEYMLEFSQCEDCGADFILRASIEANERRSKQARLEATVAYKMNKWLNKE